MGIFLGALLLDPHWGTADVEIKILSFENRSLTISLPSKRGAGQTKATHAVISPSRSIHLPVHSPLYLTVFFLLFN